MSNRLVFFLVVAAGVAADLWTKAAVFGRLDPGERFAVISGFFYLAPVRNPGAVWSLFQEVPPAAWVVLRGLIASGLLVFYLRQEALPFLVQIAFAFVLAGAIGNLHDNALTAEGSVRDFVLWVFFGWPFPTFNVADSMITVGAITLAVYYAFFEHRHRLERGGAVGGRGGR